MRRETLALEEEVVRTYCSRKAPGRGVTLQGGRLGFVWGVERDMMHVKQVSGGA